MTKVLVLYYSSYGHVDALAHAVADGVRTVDGATVAVKQVPETVPEEVRARAGFKDFDAPVATVGELADYDAIIFGTPTRFGGMAGQMKQFIDQAGGLWAANALVGKIGAVFASTGSQHGGHEATALSLHVPMLHFGMLIAGLPYTFAGQTHGDTIIGGSPYGAGTIAGADGSRQPTDTDIDGARYLGRHVAGLAAQLTAGAQVRLAA